MGGLENPDHDNMGTISSRTLQRKNFNVLGLARGLEQCGWPTHVGSFRTMILEEGSQ